MTAFLVVILSLFNSLDRQPPCPAALASLDLNSRNAFRTYTSVSVRALEKHYKTDLFTGWGRAALPARDRPILDLIIQLRDDIDAQRNFLMKLALETDELFSISKGRFDDEGHFRSTVSYRDLFKSVLKKRVETLGLKLISFSQFQKTYFPVEHYPDVETGHLPHLGPLLENGLCMFDFGAIRYSKNKHLIDMHILQAAYFGEGIDREMGSGTFLNVYKSMARDPQRTGEGISIQDIQIANADGFSYLHWNMLFDQKDSPFSHDKSPIAHIFKFIR